MLPIMWLHSGITGSTIKLHLAHYCFGTGPNSRHQLSRFNEIRFIFISADKSQILKQTSWSKKKTNANLLNSFNQANCWIPTQQMLDVPSTLGPFVGWSIEVKFSLIARLCFAFRIYFYRHLGGNGKTCPTSKYSCTCSARTGTVGGYSVENKTIRKGLTIRFPPTDSGRILCMRFHLVANLVDLLLREMWNSRMEF